MVRAWVNGMGDSWKTRVDGPEAAVEHANLPCGAARRLRSEQRTGHVVLEMERRIQGLRLAVAQRGKIARRDGRIHPGRRMNRAGCVGLPAAVAGGRRQ